MQPQDMPLVTVRLRSHWVSGNTQMTVNVDFTTDTLEEALRLIRLATPIGAPLFAQSLEEGTNA